MEVNSIRSWQRAKKTILQSRYLKYNAITYDTKWTEVKYLFVEAVNRSKFGLDRWFLCASIFPEKRCCDIITFKWNAILFLVHLKFHRNEDETKINLPLLLTYLMACVIITVHIFILLKYLFTAYKDFFSEFQGFRGGVPQDYAGVSLFEI
jgi:hypothetical protein